jgi:ferredoxin
VQAEAVEPSAGIVGKAPVPGVAVATFARSKRTALLPPTKTILEASEDVGVNIDYSCRVGTCGVCKVKLLSGAVTMEVQDALDANDKQNNIILACQAKATADVSVDA